MQQEHGSFQVQLIRERSRPPHILIGGLVSSVYSSPSAEKHWGGVAIYIYHIQSGKHFLSAAQRPNVHSQIDMMQKQQGEEVESKHRNSVPPSREEESQFPAPLTNRWDHTGLPLVMVFFLQHWGSSPSSGLRSLCPVAEAQVCFPSLLQTQAVIMCNFQGCCHTSCSIKPGFPVYSGVMHF